jgi:hypothetical protein
MEPKIDETSNLDDTSMSEKTSNQTTASTESMELVESSTINQPRKRILSHKVNDKNFVASAELKQLGMVPPSPVIQKKVVRSKRSKRKPNIPTNLERDYKIDNSHTNIDRKTPSQQYKLTSDSTSSFSSIEIDSLSPTNSDTTPPDSPNHSATTEKTPLDFLEKNHTTKHKLSKKGKRSRKQCKTSTSSSSSSSSTNPVDVSSSSNEDPFTSGSASKKRKTIEINQLEVSAIEVLVKNIKLHQTQKVPSIGLQSTMPMTLPMLKKATSFPRNILENQQQSVENNYLCIVKSLVREAALQSHNTRCSTNYTPMFFQPDVDQSMIVNTAQKIINGHRFQSIITLSQTKLESLKYQNSNLYNQMGLDQENTWEHLRRDAPPTQDNPLLKTLTTLIQHRDFQEIDNYLAILYLAYRNKMQTIKDLPNIIRRSYEYVPTQNVMGFQFTF